MAGKTLGHYALQREIGAGGMGVVYEATDSRLGRSVAIKLVHESFVRDAEHMMRFEREARVLASLNHPNIASIHGLEEADGQRFLVLEYVPGKTLAEVIAAKGLRLKEALAICRDVAEALEAAHEKGIVHRDLKPANIKVTPEGKVKVLDFGIAKAVGTPEPTKETTVTVNADTTQAGLVVGTAAYMSPEQACGKPVDRRTDVWALGCVLYEALCGVRPFRGETTTEVVAGILEREPDWSALPPSVPDNVRSLLRRCLQKNPHARLHDIGDARIEIEDALAAGGTATTSAIPSRTARRHLLAGTVAGVLLGAVTAGALAYRYGERSSPPPRVARFTIEIPDGRAIIPSFNPQVMFSRDAKSLLFAAVTNDATQIPSLIYRRRLEDTDSKLLIKALSTPVFSPDNEWLMLFARAKLIKYPLSGGAPVPVADTDFFSRGDWGPDGYYYWTRTYPGGIIRTPVSGGSNEPVVALDERKQERILKHAQLLPGGRALIFTVGYGGIESYDDARIDAYDLRSRKRFPLVQGGTFPRYSPSGHIVYARGGSLYATPFDEGKLEVTGPPRKVVDGVLMSTNTGTAYFDVSPAGDLAYAVGSTEGGERTLHWVDRSGKATPLPLPPRSYLHPRISPDGRQLAIEVEGVNHDFYVYDFDRDVMTRITNDGLSHGPTWTPDARHLAFRSWKAGTMTMWWLPADRSGPPERLTSIGARQSVDEFSPDGRYMTFDQMDPGTGSHVWVLPLAGDKIPKPFDNSRAIEGSAKFSPDGKWVVYCSTESGRPEVYAQSWPGPGPKIQISSDGGTDPIWRRDGKEIFYRNGEKMMAVPVSLGPPLRPGRPALLWQGPYAHGMSSSCGMPGPTSANYDVTADGQRFLMVKDNDRDVRATRIVVILNWAQELKKR